MLIDTTHRDIIHDIAYYFDGNQFATASSDQTMRVYNKKMKKSADCKCHDGPIWKIRWADSKFGQLIATCSQDKGVSAWEVWEEEKFLQEDRNKYQYNGNREQQFQRARKLQLTYNLVQNQMVYYWLQHMLMENYNSQTISWNHAPLEREMLVAAGNAEQQKYLSKIQIDHFNGVKLWLYECQNMSIKNLE
ncbi:unnamed protein product [Paramecium pentaurelia]|uniref:Uncharacterized protein n=1 Tax=Paramecium pentaurelia TaxID=43138 RepID=A0A8S1U7I4_9CILI|nr:unnamed protein product [Paramecium pentaurelia]